MPIEAPSKTVRKRASASTCAPGVELGGVADRSRQDDREQLERVEVVLREDVRLLGEHRDQPDGDVAVPERHGDHRADAALAGKRVGELVGVVADRRPVAAVDTAGERVVVPSR